MLIITIIVRKRNEKIKKKLVFYLISKCRRKPSLIDHVFKVVTVLLMFVQLWVVKVI